MRPLTRRRFLTLSGLALAGAACGGSSRGGRSRTDGAERFPRGDSPIEHVVLIIKENRSYDALFAELPDGIGQIEALPSCRDVIDGDDVPHDRETALHPERHVRCVEPAEEVAAYRALARRYALCSHYFSEFRGPSFPNHMMMIAAETPVDGNPRGGPHHWHCPEHCWDLRTFADAFAEEGLSWRSYDHTGFVSPFSMIDHLRDSPNVLDWEAFARDARSGSLPHLAWLYSEESDSDHPPQSLCTGQSWTLEQLRAIAEGPQWESTAVFVTWDEWGGFADHLTPPVLERDADGQPTRYGYRVPCLVVSPWARPGYVSAETKSHLSLLRFASESFGVPPLNERVLQAGSMLDCFDFTQTPQPAELPPPLEC